MANTYVQIGSTVTVGVGGAASIDFTSIPATYTDLILKFSCRTSGTADNFENIKLQFNGSGGTAYSDRIVYGNTVSALSASNSSQAFTYFQYSNAAGSDASTFSNNEMYIPNYAGSNNKSVSVDSVTEKNAATINSAIAALAAELWANSAAINRITLTPNVATLFAQYSTASLYGIKKN
jgi:hypothetical protein